MSRDPSVDKVDSKLLQTTRYDRAASLLISLLILSTTSFFVLVLLWLAYTPTSRTLPPDIEWVGGGEREEGTLGELDSPQLEELAGMPAEDIVSSLQALMSSDAVERASQLAVTGPGGSPGRGPGSDPDRLPGLPDQVPRGERWEVRYSAATLTAYARQLDFFEIELGAAGGKPQVDYASGFARSTPLTRTAQPRDEKRLYLTWRGGRLQQWDRKLLAGAGIKTEGRILMQFYPAKTEEALARIELEHADGKSADQIRKTVFQAKPKGSGYEFVVLAQRYR
jgi:hypothetical protein